MYKLYYIVSNKTSYYYIGITKGSLSARFASHKYSSKRGVRSPLYDCMRKYGSGAFMIVLVNEYKTWQECCDAEITAIANARSNNHKILNLAKGGNGGFVVQNIREWKQKLSLARKGQTPFLGKKHTNKTKRKCQVASRHYWEEHKLYHKEEIKNLSFKEAHEKLGISKTHYYRLKRLLINDQ